MTFLSAAEVVLKSAKRPMTAAEIADEALRRGLIETTGKTPTSTMTAKLYVSIKTNPNGPIQRKFVSGTDRAARGSVRWIWNGR